MMNWRLSNVRSQKGRVAIVTGANAGLGFETALGLAQLGATIVLASRNMKRLERAKADILTSCPAADLVCMALDLGDLASVQAFAAEFMGRYERLDLLINNAGIMMTPYHLTVDGFESQLAVNYIGHFALTNHLLPLLNGTNGARIVTLSSLAHRWWKIQLDDLHFEQGYDARNAYGQSKLACLMFAYELSRRLERARSGVLSLAAHPGFSNTSLFRDMPKFMQFVVPLVTQSAGAGALPTLYAALGEDIAGGDYCGPSGYKQYWGAPAKVGSSKASRDETMADKLWRQTEKLTLSV